MSAVSELRERVAELENEVAILRTAIAEMLHKTGIQDHSIDMVKVKDDDDEYTAVGYKGAR